MNLEIIVSSRKAVPIYEQIETQIEDAILNGVLKEGEVIPGIRTLAKMLRVSVITVQKAYENLNRKGLIFSAAGRGTMVAAVDQKAMMETRLAQLDDLLQQSADLAKAMHLSFSQTSARLQQFMEADPPKEGSASKGELE